MFRMDQIVTATHFLRHFRALADYLIKADEPLLITQKGGRFLVVMDAAFFEGMMIAQHSWHTAPLKPEREQAQHNEAQEK